jgi:hypothetical protein
MNCTRLAILIFWLLVFALRSPCALGDAPPLPPMHTPRIAESTPLYAGVDLQLELHREICAFPVDQTVTVTGSVINVRHIGVGLIDPFCVAPASERIARFPIGRFPAGEYIIHYELRVNPGHWFDLSNPFVIRQAPAVSVPANSWNGMIALALIVLAVGVFTAAHSTRRG